MIRFVPLLVIAGLLAAPAAQARQRSATERQRRHFQAAELYYRQGDFLRALGEYKKALEAKRHPSIIFNIGQCHRQLGNWKKALFFYKLFLSEAPGAANRAEVEAWIREMQRKIAAAEAAARARGKVSIVTTPPGAEVRIDRFKGKPDGVSPVILTVQAGTHLIVIQKPGYKVTQRTVKVDRDEVEALEVTLPPLGPARPVVRRVEPRPRERARRAAPPRPRERVRRAAPPRPREQVRRTAPPQPRRRARGTLGLEDQGAAAPTPVYKRWWFGLGYGVTGALLVGAVVTGLLTVKRSKDWDQYHLASDQSTGRTLAATTDGLIGAAAAVGIATTIATLVVWSRLKKERAAPQAVVAPSCGPGGCGLWVQGRF